MSRPGEDDRDAVDRAFADLVSKFHLTADRSQTTRVEQPGDSSPMSTTETVSTSNDAVSTSNDAVSTSNDAVSTSNDAVSGTDDTAGAETPNGHEQPLPDSSWADSQPLFRFSEAATPTERPEPEDRFVPEPPMPLRRPAWPVLVAWLAMGYAVLAVLATALGVRLPVWAGWLALIGFVGGFGLLVARLPRHRPPDAGDGAVL